MQAGWWGLKSPAGGRLNLVIPRNTGLENIPSIIINLLMIMVVRMVYLNYYFNVFSEIQIFLTYSEVSPND